MMLSYIDANRLIYQLGSNKGQKLSEEYRSDIVKYSGRYDNWIEPIVDYYIANSYPTFVDLYQHLNRNQLFDLLWKNIPEREHIYFINPQLARIDSYSSKEKLITNDKIFSPLFEKWVNVNTVYSTDKIYKTLLTKSESLILQVLYSNLGKVTPRDEIAEYLWKDEWLDKYSDWAIDRLIHQVRKKLTSCYKITTVRERGYMLTPKGTKIIKAPEIVKPPSGTLPTTSYLEYMNDPNNKRKVLKDLFQSLENEKLMAKFLPLKNNIDLNILVINSYSYDNIDAVNKWIQSSFSAENYHIYFTNIDEAALEIHRNRVDDLNLENFSILYDDIRNTRLQSNSFDIIINDFRLNFNTSHSQNLKAISNINKILNDGGLVLISVVVDARYESERFGKDQEKAPINKNSPWSFMAGEKLERKCFTVPYYIQLFSNNGFNIIKEFDLSDGKGWKGWEKIDFDNNRKPAYRRFLLNKR